MHNPKRIGILALQGNFQEHAQKLKELGCDTVEVRRTNQLENIDALIIPGGESTTVGILESAEATFANSSNSNHIGVFDAIIDKAHQGMPIWGTCMGSILLAKDIEGSKQGRLSLMDISVKRNAFGPQRYSSEIPIHLPKLGDEAFPGIFIRAPIITSVGEDVEVLGTLQEGIVMARQGSYLATVFHPEVVQDHRVHEYFLSMIK